VACRRWDKGDLLFSPKKKYTRYEKARIVGARALQIAMGAPVLVGVPENLGNPIDIALIKFEKGAIPITVVRRLPGKRETE
jgi:DNA-directed RNA polymerase subunit K